MQSLHLDDFTNYTFLSGIDYAPDGRAAAFIAAKANMEENEYERYIYLYENGGIRRLTGMGKEGSFFWLDNTHLVFPAVRTAAEKKRQEAKDPFTSYYKIDIHGGEAEPYFTLSFGAGRLKVLDETHFAVTASIDTAHPDLYQLTGDERQAILKEYTENADYEVLTESPFWFNGAGFLGSHRSALFLIDLSDGEPVVTRVSGPMESTGHLEILGEELLYSSEEFTVKPPLYGFCLKAVNWRTGSVREICRYDEYSLEGLAAADGVIYVMANDGKRHGINENAWVYTLDAGTGALTLLREEQFSMYGSVGSDCRLGGGRQSAVKGSSLYHITTREGDALLYRLDKDGSSTPVITKAGSLDEFALSSENDTLLLIAMYDMKLQEVYAYENGALRQISHFNDDALKDRYVAQPEFLEVESEGFTIGGWVLKPKDYDPSKSYPAVFDIHGGPKTAYGPVFYHEMQFWANEGYFVFFCNPKGSDGRDNAFADIRGEYGYTDYKNLMDFCDAVLKAYPQIDASRVCETGGSYGGFMTNWIIGHTDRFCCTASQRSISNWLSFYGVSDIGPYFSKDQTAGDPWESPEKMWEHSPLKYAANVKTPTLFIHSDQDYRCPLEQGLQMYTALFEQGVETRLCLFHGENHELSRSGKPKHRIRRLQEITDWFARFSAR